MNRTNAVRKASEPAKPSKKKPPAATRSTSVAKKTAVAGPKASGPTASERAVPIPKSKSKLVRDSFTIPKSEYALLEGLKVRAVNLMRPTKKSELIRAGISALHTMTDKAFLSALSAVPSLKTGRPKTAEKNTQAGKGSGER